MTNIIKQIISDENSQTIKVIVRDNERGPEGEKGDPGLAATIEAGQAYSVPSSEQPAVMNTGTDNHAVFDFYIPKGEKGEPGNDGAFYYKAGTGINITDDHVINATGEATAAWGGIIGNINNQTDLINLIDSKQAIWGNITGNINNQTDLAQYISQISPKNVWYATCSTVESEVHKVVTTTTGDFVKADGNVIFVNFTYAGTGIMTLNIDGTSKYAVQPSATVGRTWSAGEVCCFVASGNRYYLIGKGKASTTAYGATMLYDGYDSNSNFLAATANSVKMVHDLIPTVNDSTISLTNNGVAVDSFTTNASSNKTIDLASPVITMTTTDPGEGAALAANNFIAVYSA